METTAQFGLKNVARTSEKTSHVKEESKTMTDFWTKMENMRFALIAMIITAVTCLGGVATAYILDKSFFEFAAVVIPAMMVEVLILAVAPMRWIIITAVVSCVSSLFFIALSVFS